LPRSSSASTSALPSGLAVLKTIPDVLFIPEIILGGLVWILVASSEVPGPILQGWVMFVSVFCFIMSISLLCFYYCGVHGGGSGHWVTLVRASDNPQGLPCPAEQDVARHEACAQCWSGTVQQKIDCCVFPPQVFAFVATLLYVIHVVFSLVRWKSS
ncbi:MAL protein, partial [Chloropsis cyanopogon]|nr:MAL protein [Chloropsis cyanopogon]